MKVKKGWKLKTSLGNNENVNVRRFPGEKVMYEGLCEVLYYSK